MDNGNGLRSILLNHAKRRPLTTIPPIQRYRARRSFFTFLFVIMAEGLGRYLSQAIQTNQLKGIKVVHQGPIVTHHRFVNDTMLMGTPTVKEARTFNKVLSTFMEASGMEINLTKSIFLQHFYSYANKSQKISQDLEELPSNQIPWHPTFRIHPQSCKLGDLLNKMKARLSSWTHRALNMASRLVLVKSVLQTMPAYMLSALAAPNSVYKSIWNI